MNKVSHGEGKGSSSGLLDLVNSKIDRLRPKLLDLSRRNPLISTKFSDRSNSLVRIVDEVPEFLLQSLLANEMRIVSLPNLGTNPPDEQSREFQDALAEARINDEVYIAQLDKIDQESDDAPNLFAQFEHELKDRLRTRLNMPERQTKDNLSLQQHARNHGIMPNYELPTSEDRHEDGRHVDRDIQTLLLPDILERRLNGLFTKEKTWKEETGIGVLHATFGFLEWEDGNSRSTQFSPLILTPVQIEKKRSRYGQEFWVSSDEGEAHINNVLAEKLRLEFNIVLPEFDGQDLEEYFLEVAKQSPKNMIWRVRRWAAIGVFPSARLAMYHDLDPKEWDFASNEIVSALFGGSEMSTDLSPFGEEYDVDKAEIESKVPYLVSDADSSQFSTMVDIANGRNLAVEGPPGTGKSQTIVNTIASSLASGKKVLFIAEKSAALEVVRSRLDAAGIGNFILPLLASRSTKEQVISSIRDRIEMESCPNPSELDRAIEQYREARKKLKSYIEIVSSKYAESDLDVHTVLGRSIRYSDLIRDFSSAVSKFFCPDVKNISSEKLKKILHSCEQIEESWRNVTAHSEYWSKIQVPNIDPFHVNELLDLAAEVSELFREAAEKRTHLIQYGIQEIAARQNLQELNDLLHSFPDPFLREEIEFIKRITSLEELEIVSSYLKEVGSWQSERDRTAQYLSSDIDSTSSEDLLKIRDLCLKHNLASIRNEDLNSLVTVYEKSLEDHRQVKKIYERIVNISKIFKNCTASDILKVTKLVTSLSRQVLGLRKQQLDDPSIQILLEKQHEKLKLLREKQKLLDEKFTLPSKIDHITVEKNITILASASLFSFFSRDYRKARKFYFSICKESKFRKEHAVSMFRDLAAWQSDVRDFAENEIVREMLGPYFDSLNSDFSPFMKVICFFKQVDECFSGSEYTSLRNFLKYSELEMIESLPILEENHPIHNMKELRLEEIYDLIFALEENLRTSESDITDLKILGEVFRYPEKMQKNELLEIPVNFELLLDEREVLRKNDHVKDMLGNFFKGEQTVHDELKNTISFVASLLDMGSSIRDGVVFALEKGMQVDLRKLASQVIECDSRAFQFLEQIVLSMNSTSDNLMGDMSYAKFSEWMSGASKDRDGLIAHSRFLSVKKRIEEDGYLPLVESVISEGKNNIPTIVEAVIMRQMARDIYHLYGKTLVSYNGMKLDNLRKQIREMDRKIIKLSRQRLQSELFHKAHPPRGISSGRKSEYTELALLRNEISKKQRYVSIRSLTKRSAEALLELKPCWMMSPLAVAQYLPKGGIEFDLVIIDEASQMTPEDAVGALVRSKQAMVVGDTNQLPPTGFFRKVLEDEEADEDEKVSEESILEMANACFRPARRLRWHYRSRNSSLISFSNKHVYSGDLVVFPSAYENNPVMGVSYQKVNGAYSSGVNTEEAKVMVDAILHFMKEHENKSLGVVLLNQKQRDLLIDEMNYALEHHPHAMRYIEKWEEEKEGLESFFIKNLENVQGDERDVIFIGTVYGPEKEGDPVMQRFGPINGVAGKRRLNVLFSRAKERIVTFSSMTASDIRADENGNPGVYMLKCWLEYSSTGVLEMGTPLGKMPDSDFEEYVIKQIRSIGCEAVPQVGVKGYSIDIGVRHPDWPHGFIMGVECDGATYHSSRSARDRDRLRQEVLEGLGWYLYRIWSTDWFEDPVRESEKLRMVIQKRIKDLTEYKKVQVM